MKKETILKDNDKQFAEGLFKIKSLTQFFIVCLSLSTLLCTVEDRQIMQMHEFTKARRNEVKLNSCFPKLPFDNFSLAWIIVFHSNLNTKTVLLSRIFPIVLSLIFLSGMRAVLPMLIILAWKKKWNGSKNWMVSSYGYV